jgi:hypothetical protein
MIKNIIKNVLFRKNKLRDRRNISGKKQRLFFVHVPKTAGSSFRGAFENNAVTYKDYGNNPNSTTELVQKNIYNTKDFYALKSCFEQHNYAWITGHVNLAKYINFVPVTHTISFVRDPLEQVLSHFNHYVKYLGFTGDLDAFLDKPFANNVQSKLLEFMPLNLLGCLGITEHYNDSLALINDQFTLTLPRIKVNVNNTKQLTSKLLNDVVKHKIIKNNQRDIDMYAQAEFLHLQRFRLFQENKPWTYGTATINAKNILTGCAYFSNSSDAVTLIIQKNDNDIAEIEAKNFYPNYVKANFPRDRYIGFHYPLPEDLKKDDEIDVVVKLTRQKINYKPFKAHL